MTLGGRASEEINLGDVTTGAENDLETVTRLARKMVCDFGMSQRLGNVTLGKRHGPLFLGRDIVEERNYSEETAKLIDEEVKHLVDESYLQAKRLIQQNIDKLKILTNALLEKEVLDGEEVKQLIGMSKAEDKSMGQTSKLQNEIDEDEINCRFEV